MPRSGKQPCLNFSAPSKKLERPEQNAASVTPGPCLPSITTLSQRFRRAIQQGDLSAAQRIAARAYELQSHPRPAGSDEINDATSPPPRAAVRAAEAQRSSSAHPFDVRNVEPLSEHNTLTKHHHHRKYTLAIHDETLTDTTSSADPSLVIAIKNNADVELVRWLIEMGHEREDPSVDADGNTVLHLATLYDRSDIIYAYSTYTTSHVAATLADLIDAETQHDHRTPLHLACIRGFDDVARQLLDLGADVDLQDRAGNTALHFASAWGHISLVQLLIERGCSLAVKNLEGSTASEYAYSHSVKDALETLGRARYESRKKTRRVPVATVMPAAIRPSASSAASAHSDEPSTSEKHGRSRPFPSFLSRSGSLSGASRSNNTTPVRTTFADTRAGGDRTPEPIDDWDPEKTFAQPGQDLFPSTRGAFSSPPIQRVASPANFSTPGRASIDLYSEVLNQSPRAATGFAATTAAAQPRALAQSPPTVRSPDEAMMQRQAAKGLVPQTSSEAEMRRPQLSLRLGPIRRTPSPGHGGMGGASADKVRMQDAAAMSLFRSTTPQPSHVPGRIDTPPLTYRSESPFLVSSKQPTRGGVKITPPTAETMLKGEAGGSGVGEGPPLLAPIATLARFTSEDSRKNDTTRVGPDERQGRLVAVQGQTDGVGASGRRDSSPSTPRPDDRETFG